MREKVFQTIYRLIQKGAISAEEAYYIIEAIFEKSNYTYIPSTWTTTTPQINIPDRGMNDFWKQSTNGVPNITFATNSCSNNITACSSSNNIAYTAETSINSKDNTCDIQTTDILG